MGVCGECQSLVLCLQNRHIGSPHNIATATTHTLNRTSRTFRLQRMMDSVAKSFSQLTTILLFQRICLYIAITLEAFNAFAGSQSTEEIHSR
jgi:hypothetical protein